MLIGYVSLLSVVAVVIVFSLNAGGNKESTPELGASYTVEQASPCLGSGLKVIQSGELVDIQGVAGGGGKLRLKHGSLTGTVKCSKGGSTERFAAALSGKGPDRQLIGSVGGVPFTARFRQVSAADLGGFYSVQRASPCLGASLKVIQAGELVDIEGEAGAEGKLRFKSGSLSGTVTCGNGTTEKFAAGFSIDKELTGSVGGVPFTAGFRQVSAGAATECQRSTPSPENTFGRLMLAIAVVIVAARFLGAAVGRIGQPRVMGEVLAGILLGPTLLGSVAHGVSCYFFPADIVPLLRAGADIGLVFYMFLVGLELDPRMLRGRVEQAAFISHGSIAIPMALGIAAAVPIYQLVGPASEFAPFAVFMGVSMSITAFPVLARILVERRMLKRPVGAMAIGAAAVDDVTAWGLLALASGLAVAAMHATGKAPNVPLNLGKVILFALLFSAFMALVSRRLLARVADAYDEAGHVPAGWIAAIFIGVLLSAYASAQIPVAAIFGAFVMGLIMPRRADLTHDVTRRVEDFVITVMLPLFFVVTGLRTQINKLDRPVLWILTLVLVAVAVFSKFAGATAAARFTGIPLRQSAAIGALMNTRGLTELIVLNIGLDLGVITPALFTMLVVMALVTTFMTGPALKLIDSTGEMSAPVEEELREAEKRAPPEEVTPERSILVAPQDEKNADALLALAVPLAQSQPLREVILARLLTPSRVTTLIAPEDRELARASEEVDERRAALVAAGVAARAVAFTSADIGEDLLRLASEQEVDLLLVDGRRPLLGEGVPRGAVGLLLERASCDVAVLVERKAVPEIGPGHPVMVPFGGAEHDWAALELGAWIAHSLGASLKLLGAAADPREGERDASRLLGSASLAVQQLVGIAVEPVLVEPGRDGIVHAAEGAGLLVVGLSERWREEGLGPVRSAIARTAPASTLFVRRGTRPGALAPRDNVTRFTWSAIGSPSPEG
jgi:Kef-type K+ transport system membrane component KefB